MTKLNFRFYLNEISENLESVYKRCLLFIRMISFDIVLVWVFHYIGRKINISTQVHISVYGT